MRQLGESVGVFVLALGVWAVFAWAAASLASTLPGEELAAFVGGAAVLLSLLAAVGIAARIARKRLAQGRERRGPN
jgi:hypothetical protein